MNNYFNNQTIEKPNFYFYDNVLDSLIPYLLKSGGTIKSKPKIKIKKENRGKFTAYCGGNVTSSCIAKAKASGNTTLIKRATFAENTRKWKHKKGGRLNPHSTQIIPGIIDTNPNLNNMKEDYKSKRLIRKHQYGDKFTLENSIYGILHKNNIPDSVAHALLANARVESGMNPNARSGKHSGLFQFNDLQEAYIRKNYGGYGYKQQAQYISDYYNLKLNPSSYGYLSKKFRNSTMNSTDSANIAKQFYKYYERGSTNNSNLRAQWATKYANLFNQNKNKTNNIPGQTINIPKQDISQVEVPVSTYQVKPIINTTIQPTL